MNTHAETTLIGKTIGNLRIISEIGKGGMGVVYLAEHVTLPKRYAVKSLAPELTQDSEFRDRFYQEAQNQALLDHPNIVQVSDFFDTDGQFLMVMNYIDGQDVSQLIKKKGRLSEKEALHIIKEVLKGLDFAHQKGIVHRDIKPSNILIDSEGRVKIMDFGIAILTGSKRITRTGSTIGSPWYMSPEQITNPQGIDHRRDVYSTGIVLYEMVTGDVPFDSESDYTVKELQVHAPVPNPRKKNPDISPELAKIILKALEKKPENRFAGCAQFLNAIEEIERPPLPTKKKWVSMALFALTIFSVVVSIYLIIIPDSTPRNENGEGKREAQKQVAHNLIQTVSEKGLLFCREFERLNIKQEALHVALQVPTEKYIKDLLSRQIQEYEQNMEVAATEYNNLILQLSKLSKESESSKEIVNVEFDKYTELLAQKKSFDQIELLHSVKNHYQQYLNGKQDVNVKILQGACAPPLNLPGAVSSF